MHLTTSIQTLLFLLSVKGTQVAKARVRFTQTSYTVLEAPEICVEVGNDMPLSNHFTVDFTFSGALLGDNTANTRHGTIFFEVMQTTSRACINGRMVDNTPCQADISGIITLSNNSEVVVTSPSIATIIVKDDDTISATFGKNMYIISEGDAAESLFPFVNTSLSPSVAAQLRQIDGNDYDQDKLRRSLFFMDSVLTSPLKNQPLAGILVDDDIALEDVEYIVLGLAVNAEQQCVVEPTPYNSTIIIVSDDDDVGIQITRSTGRTREGEDYRLCVSTSKMIARNLRLNLKITTRTADLVDIEQTSSTFEIVLRAYDYDMMECKDIPIIQDNIVEQEEVFTIEITSAQSIPASIQSLLHLDTSPSVITIQDTSTCIEHRVGHSASDSTLYVFGGSTLCFTCQSCQSSNISWEVTSFEGNIWTGVAGGRLHSRHNLTNQGVVYNNGTLLITNSSTLFSKKSPGNITFNEASLSKLYRIILGDAAAVISLKITIEGNSTYKIVCKFRGNPQPTMQWLISHSPVKNEDRIEIIAKDNYFQSTLTLKDMKTTQYACKVFNLFGEDYSEGIILLPTTTHHSSSKNLIASYSIYVLTFLILFLL